MTGCYAGAVPDGHLSGGTMRGSSIKEFLGMATMVAGCTADVTNPVGPVLELACDATDNVLRYTCHVHVEPAQGVELIATPVDGTGLAPVFESPEASSDHTVTIRYLAHESEYTITARALETANLSTIATVTTSHLPIGMETWLTVEGQSTAPLIGTDNPCSVDDVAMIFDTTTGQVVWYEGLDPDGTLNFENMVRFTDDQTVIGETGGRLVEVDLDGNELLSFVEGVDFDGYLHHDYFATSDRIYALSKDSGDRHAVVTLDTMVVLDRTTGAEVVPRWESWVHFPVPKQATGDYFHINSVYVDDVGDVYLSLWAHDALIKLNGDLQSPAYGTPVWVIVGGSSDIPATLQLNWGELPAPHRFGHQHNLVVRRTDGRLLFLDNDNGRAVILSVDEASKTAQVDATYDAEQADCPPQGTAMEGPTGNVFVGCSSSSIREYDVVTSELIWSGAPSCPLEEEPAAARWYPLAWP